MHKFGEAQKQSDIYSLGVVMYRGLTGQYPHEADSVLGLAMKVTTEKPVSAKQLNPDIPSWLSDVIDNCLETDPEDRYVNGKALKQSITRHHTAGNTARKTKATSQAAQPRGGGSSQGLNVDHLREGLRNYTDVLKHHREETSKEFDELQECFKIFASLYEGSGAEAFKAEWQETASWFEDYLFRTKHLHKWLEERVSHLYKEGMR